MVALLDDLPREGPIEEGLAEAEDVGLVKIVADFVQRFVEDGEVEAGGILPGVGPGLALAQRAGEVAGIEGFDEKEIRGGFAVGLVVAIGTLGAEGVEEFFGRGVTDERAAI